jgi:homopolymeric O-antigen transport system ATP-binding protein
MPSEPIAIDVAGVSKAYRIGALVAGATSLREDLMQRFRERRLRDSSTLIWALRDVNLQVRGGEVLGIIGRNGSGKSTLLKILSRITPPTRGEVLLYGRVGSLLEVGTGFHPELTGRENIFLAGRILGLSPEDIRLRFDEIVAFAETASLLDTPVKRYSSGQYTRLAFAVAAHLQPEILLVDEVLAVGDAEFQRKCLGRMETVASSGRTVLFVSHNMEAITSLCTRAVLLDHGRIVSQGDAAEVVGLYLSGSRSAPLATWTGDVGDEEVRLRASRVVSADGGPPRTDRPLAVQVVLEVKRPVYGLICAVEVFAREDVMLAYSAYDDIEPPPPREIPAGLLARELVIPPNTLAAGVYRLAFDVGIHNKKRIVSGDGSLTVEVANTAGLGRRFLAARTRDVFRPAWVWRTLAPEQIAPLLRGDAH